MKPIVVFHDDDMHSYAQKLCYFLTSAGLDTLLSCDVFTESASYDNILANTSVFIVIASPQLQKSVTLTETVHEIKALGKVIFVSVQPQDNLPAWYTNVVDLSSKNKDISRGMNILLERIKKHVHNQPQILHPEKARLYNIH